MKKVAPKIIVVAPPKVSLKKVYVKDRLCRFLKTETTLLFSHVLSMIILWLRKSKLS